MNKHLITALQVIVVTGFVGLGVANIVKTNHKVKLQDIQLKSKQSDLIQLEGRFDMLNKELEQKNLDTKKTQELEQEKQNLQKQLEDAQKALQAKLEQKKAQEQKLAQAASTALGQATAYAQSGNYYKDFIYQKESGNNPNAINSIGCRGIGQACPGTKLPCGADYACQDAWFTNYAMQRYGSWENAYNFWVANNWW